MTQNIPNQFKTSYFIIFSTLLPSLCLSASLNWHSCQNNYTYLSPNHHYDPMIKAEDFKWLDRVYHLFHLGRYLCLSGALTDCFLPLENTHKTTRFSGLGLCGRPSRVSRPSCYHIFMEQFTFTRIF